MSQNEKERLNSLLKAQRERPERTHVLDERLRNHRQALHAVRERGEAMENGYEEAQENLYRYAEETGGENYVQAISRREVTAGITFGSGIFSLDAELGGGIPAGVTEIYGDESVGKTTLVAQLISNAQACQFGTAICATELLDQAYFEKLGVNLDKLYVIRGGPKKVLKRAREFLESGEHLALFIDSATALRPKVDEYNNWLGMWLSFFESVQMEPRSSIIMVNQVRARRSVDPNRGFAGGTDSTARRISNFFAARMELSRENVTEFDYDLVVQIIANVLRPPMSYIEVPVTKGEGIDVWRDLVRVARKVGVIELRGSWYYYIGPRSAELGRPDGRLGQGEFEVAKNLRYLRGRVVWEDTWRALARRPGA